MGLSPDAWSGRAIAAQTRAVKKERRKRSPEGPLILAAFGLHAHGNRLLPGPLASESGGKSTCAGGDGNDEKEMHDLFPNMRSRLRRMMPNVSTDV
jgi:hypothetical protein